MADLTAQQRDLARHALGLDGRRKQSYRNRFVTGPESIDHPAWMQMLADGFARRLDGNQLTGGDDLFWLTAAGARAALGPGETLCPEDFPNG